MSIGNVDVDRALIADWVGRPWSETVTPDSRATVEDLLRDEARSPRQRKVIHVSTAGSELPILYSTMRFSQPGHAKADSRTIGFGRELRTMESLQLRLIEAQHAMEREYWRFRQSETRFQRLFQASSEAALIVESLSLRIFEANPAAAALVSEHVAVLLSSGRCLCAARAHAQAGRRTGQLQVGGGACDAG